MEPSCCWHKEHITAEDCPSFAGREAELRSDRRRRFLQLCLECPRFRNDLRAMGGDPGGLPELLPAAIEELLALRAETRSLNQQIAARNRETQFLHEVGLLLQTSVDMDEVIAMALTAVTAGKGFGFNRAILLLIDRERQTLRGHLAVGPRSQEDAGRIWQEIEERGEPLREMARRLFEEDMASEREKFRELLAALSVPLQRREHLFVRTLEGRQSRHIRELQQDPDLDRCQAEALGGTELVLVPLMSENRQVGILLADNIITGRPVAAEDLHSLETFALPVAFAIERAAHYERLQEELEKRAEANRRLREQQEQILRMEKMALVGNLTANIAHSIRNPLTIIGGFARTLARQTPPGDSTRQYIDSIVRESARLEEALQEILGYSESLHPTFDLWDVNPLISGVHGKLREQLETGGVTCRLDLEADLPPIAIDFKKLSYCLRTIVRQGLAAMPEGGAMTIRTGRQGDLLLIVVSHTGDAMEPEAIRAVTTPAFPFEGQGGGVGLALCARILKEHDADLRIDSSDETGTTFTIRMPLPKEKNHDPTAGG